MLHEAAVRAVDTKIFDREVIASVFAETGATTRDDILPPTFPMNAATDKAYRGVNVVALWVDAMAKRYISGYWASYKQWQTLGAQVRKGEHGSSLIEQKSAIEVFADRNGLSISAWFEETETAAKQGRRMFTQMLTDLNARKADGLIIHKIDRSARNLRDWADLGDLIDRGVDVRFVSDNFDLLSRGGRLSADIQAVVAADYIRNLREEVKKGLYGRLKQGIYPFAAPIGYRNGGKGGKLKTIDPVTGPLVRYAFERYATRTVSFAELRHELAQRGLRTKSGKPLYPNSLTLIFNNPFYAGVLRLGSTGETFAGAHEPLIPTALFQRVQAILRGKTVPRQRSINFSFGKW